MNAITQTLEIKGSPFKLVGLAALSLAMTALCTVIALGYIPVRDGSFEQFAIWLGMLFFGVGTLFICKQLLSAGKPVLTLSPTGYLDRRISERPIPWASIHDVLVWTMHGQKIIVLQVSPETEAAIGLSRVARWSRGANAKLGADGLSTNAAGLKISHKALLDAILERVTLAKAKH